MSDPSLNDIDALARRLSLWSQRCPKETKLALEGAADLVIARSQTTYLRAAQGDHSKLHVRSGRLWRSIHKRVAVNAHEIKAEIGTNVVYARIHELGGTIIPRHAAYLHFKTLDGNWVMTKTVTMPPRPFLSTALRDKKPELPKMIMAQLMTIWNKVGVNNGG